MRLYLTLFCFLSWTDSYVLGVVDNEIEGLSDNLKTEVEKYVSNLVSSLTENYDNRISKLEKELAMQKKRIKTLEASEQLLKDALADCECDNAKSLDNSEITENQGKEDVGSIELLKQEQKTRFVKTPLRKVRNRIRRNVENEVAFFASLSNSIDHLGGNQDIPFDNVVTNRGNAYNGHHGTFIAPVAGTYVFSVTLHSSGAQTWGHFVVNGNILAKLHVHEDQSTQTVVVDLKAGDDVSVQNSAPDKSLFGDRYSSFCGFLLYEDPTSSPIVG